MAKNFKHIKISLLATVLAGALYVVTLFRTFSMKFVDSFYIWGVNLFSVGITIVVIGCALYFVLSIIRFQDSKNKKLFTSFVMGGALLVGAVYLFALASFGDLFSGSEKIRDKVVLNGKTKKVYYIYENPVFLGMTVSYLENNPFVLYKREHHSPVLSKIIEFDFEYGTSLVSGDSLTIFPKHNWKYKTDKVIYDYEADSLIEHISKGRKF